MTVMEPATRTAPEPSNPRAPRSGRTRGRGGIAIVMAASLALSAVTRLWADHSRNAALPHQGEAAATTGSLSSMNSFALGLLLGGLRGPLVMVLWTDSENQKAAKNLEGVDTEIEWIRLLQPEFDTVHLFQIWNKAYNISVQMASLANKYVTILGALDYAHNVDTQKPNDINILGAVGQLFFDKLGTSGEKAYYRRRVREDSKPHAVDASLRRRDAGWRRSSMDPILDAKGFLLASAKVDLPYLANPNYEPYTDGVSVFGYAYNYYKRSERLLTVQHQHHDQLSDIVIDSRPALTLKNWADDEVRQARHREAEAFAVKAVEDGPDPDGVTANLPPDRPVADRAALALAIDDYDRATRIVPDSMVEYRRTHERYPEREQQDRLYISELTHEGEMAAADRDYLKAMTATGSNRADLLAAARAAYVKAEVGYDLVSLRYCLPYQANAQVIPPGFAQLPTGKQQPLEEMSEQQVLTATAAASRVLAETPAVQDPTSDWNEYQVHVRRVVKRIALIDAALAAK